MKKALWCHLHTLLSLVLFLYCFPQDVPAVTYTPDIQKGGAIFNTKCAACHSIGAGKKVGPDLKGITATRSKEWLEKFISNPDPMFASDPEAKQLLQSYKIKMPNLGLSDEDVDAVLSYIQSQSGAPQPLQPAERTPSGDPSAGRDYFIGSRELRNRGAPCIGCHSVSVVDFMGGGNLGPDLTQAYSKYGQGLAAVLTNIPFPVMIPVFAHHPILPEEAADLTAFLKIAGTFEGRVPTGRIVIITIISFLILLAIIGFVWRKRLISVRAHMVRSQKKRTGEEVK